MDEITRLVESLGVSDAADDEQVLALLAVHGRKAVDSLLGAASAPEAGRRAAAVTALGRIGDPRGRRAVTLSLSDRSPAVRAAAATAMSAFPSEAAATRLRGMLAREPDVEVRVRAAGTLVVIFNGGAVEALDTLLSLAGNRSEDRRVRLEALKVLGSLPPGEARAISSGLVHEPDQRIAQIAGRFCGTELPTQEAGAKSALDELHGEDYFTHRRAASLLVSLGEAALPMLVRSLRARGTDAAACARVASVMREIVCGRERSLAPLLEEVDETTPLGLMVDIIGASQDLTALYHLKGVIDRIAAENGSSGDAEAPARRMIAAKAHYYLARAGSRVAYDDLRTMLARHDEPLAGEVLMAVEEIGGREEVPDLLAHFGREQTGWMRDRLREALRQVMSRARVKSDDPFFHHLDDAARAILEEIQSAPQRPPQPAGRSRRRGSFYNPGRL